VDLGPIRSIGPAAPSDLSGKPEIGPFATVDECPMSSLFFPTFAGFFHQRKIANRNSESLLLQGCGLWLWLDIRNKEIKI